MDPIFNKLFIPKQSEGVHIIRPAGKTFVTGLASRYDDDSYDSGLLSALPEKEYRHLIGSINDVLFNYWPCMLCQVIGYCLCPFTLGLSFLCPGLAVSDARKHVMIEIESINTELLRSLGMEMSLHIRCGTSWLEIKVESFSFTTDGGIEMPLVRGQ